MGEQDHNAAIAYVTSEVAQIDAARDRDTKEIERDYSIVVALIEGATHIAAHAEDKPGEDPCVDDARTFLQAWWKRKMPSLDMPRL